MKKKRISIIIFVLCVSLVFAGCTGGTQQNENGGKSIALNFATFWPGENFYVTEGHRVWADTIKNRVETETDHTIDFIMHSGGSLLGASEIYEGVSMGAADLGSTCPSYSPGVFPATSVFELPGFINKDAVAASLAIQEAYETIEHIQREYEDVKVMHFWATGPGDLLTKTPVTTLEELQGMEIRVAGGSVAAIEALGAAPVTMPMGDAYLSLNQGIVRGILGPGEILKGFRLAEVTESITKTPFLYNVIFIKVMNQNTWDALPEEVQVIFEEVNGSFVEHYATLGKEQSVIGEEFAKENFGHQVIELSDEEEQRWLATLADVQQKWVRDANRIGLPAEELLDKAHQLDQEYSQ